MTTPALQPVPPRERIAALDLLRGFALFGVLWSNLNDWYGTTDPVTGLDQGLAWMQQWLIESRFYSLLGFVFGIGFAIQLGRAEERGGDVRPVFYRRMLALLLFGIAHVIFLWRGDILVQYALLGCVLVLYRDLKPRALLVAAALTWIVLPYVITHTRLALHHIPVPFSPHGVQDWIYAHGTYLQVLPVRVADFLDWYGRWPFGVFPGFLVLFVLGLWAERVGLMSRFGEYLPAIRRAFWVALGVAALGLLLGFGLNRIWPWPTELPFDWRKASFWSPQGTIKRAVGDLFTWGTAALYGIGLVLLAQRPKGAAVLAPLAFVGRMPLTTYLTQSLVCSLLFYGYGLGWYGTVSFSGMLMITCTLFAVQILVSRWWLRRFRFGPAEWLWRSLAYARRQPMRFTSPEPAGALSAP